MRKLRRSKIKFGTHWAMMDLKIRRSSKPLRNWRQSRIDCQQLLSTCCTRRSKMAGKSVTSTASVTKRVQPSCYSSPRRDSASEVLPQFPGTAKACTKKTVNHSSSRSTREHLSLSRTTAPWQSTIRVNLDLTSGVATSDISKV